MKRALTGIAAASMALGMMAPAAFAATSSSSMTWQQEYISVGSTMTGFKGFAADYAGSPTNYMPIYYVNEALKNMGFTVTWDGTNLFINNSTIKAPTNVTPGMGPNGIYLNGVLVQKTTVKVAKDPASKVNTSYMPIYFVLKVLQDVGVAQTSDWNGTVLKMTKPAPAPVGTGAALSTLAVSGQTVGSGTQQSPAVNTSGAGVTLSTTLTDANGNPISNAQLTVELDSTVTATPTVEQGTTFETISNPSADVYTATVTTDASGVAKFTVTGVGAYTVTVTAPYSNNGTAVTTSGYIGFAANTALIAPGSTANAFSATPATLASQGTGVVPVTVTLPLDANGNVQSGVAVTFSTSTGSKAFFTNSAGSLNLGNSFTINSDSNGQATVYVNDYATETVTISASATADDGTGTTYSPATAIDWANATAASPLSAIGAYAFQPSNSLTAAGATSVAGIPAGTEAYFVPFNAGGEFMSSAQNSSGNATYTLSASNGGVITSINGVQLSSLAGGALGTPSSVQLGVSWDSTGYLYTVNGVQLTSTDNSNGFFSVGVSAGSSATGSGSVLTVANGSVKATADYNYSGSNGEYVTNFSPVYGSLSTPGSSQTVSFTVVDANGNPVSDSSAVVEYDNNESNLWVTAVNGVALSQNYGSGNEPTPVPLYTQSGLGYSTGFSIPGVMSWTSPTGSTGNLNVVTDANGKVSLTLQSGYVTYYNGSTTGSAVTNSGGTTPSSTVYGYTYSGNTSNTNQLYIGTSPATGYTKVGQIGW